MNALRETLDFLYLAAGVAAALCFISVLALISLLKGDHRHLRSDPDNCG